MRFKVVLILILGIFVLSNGVFAVGNFTSTWDTTKTSSGSSNSTTISLPLEDGGEYNFTVYWGDGSNSSVTTWNSANKTHNYGTAGNYTIDIIGELKGFRFNNVGDRNKLIDIINWGVLELGNNGGYFRGAANLVNISATDVDLGETTNLQSMFSRATNFNGSVNYWDVSKVTSFRSVFFNAEKFNQPLDDWDTSSATNMRTMFSGAKRFNQDIGDWDTSKVTNMFGMFFNSNDFNQDIGDWGHFKSY